MVARDLVKEFPITSGVFGRTVAKVHAVSGVSLHVAGGRDARVGGGVGLRQVDDRPAAVEPDPPDVGRRRVRGQRHLAPRRRRELREHARSASRSCSKTRTRRSTRACRSAARSPSRCACTASMSKSGRAPYASPSCSSRSASRPSMRRVPARVLRRSAPARRHRARARAGTVAHRARRARLGARRVDPGRRREPARTPAGRARPRVRVHRARPLGRPPHLRPCRGDVPRQDRRGRDRARHLPTARPPVHAGAAVRDPVARPAARARAQAASCSQGDPPSARSRRRPVAGSARGAGRRKRSARRKSRRWWTAATATPWPATSRSRSGSSEP